MATSGGGANSRLSVDDWVQEGLWVLAEDGVKALTLGRLCSRLGVTKGSFYWHFTDMKGYREALIGTWGAVRDEHRAACRPYDSRRRPGRRGACRARIPGCDRRSAGSSRRRDRR